MAKEKKVESSQGWKNVRVSIDGAPAKTYTVYSVRDAIEDYRRDFGISKERDHKQFKIEEAK